MRKIYHLCLIGIFCFGTAALYGQETPVPPSDLQGNLMKNWLKANYYDGRHQMLDYSVARRSLYSFIDQVDGKIRCVYSGYEEEWPNMQVTSWGNINTEHTVPQSFYDDANPNPMRTDMHHLFPTFESWNTLRSAFPYAEIPDNETEQWIRNITSQSNVPSNATRDEWSEYKLGAFEPREDHKGDVARSIFYFYTMYQAYDINRVSTVQTLCDWHVKDPVSQKEKDRNTGIAAFQGNLNPYIIYPNVASNVYGCDEVPTSVAKNTLDGRLDAMVVIPTGSINAYKLLIRGNLSGNCSIRVYSTDAKQILSEDFQLNTGLNELAFKLNDAIPHGIYIASLIYQNEVVSRPFLVGYVD